MSKIDYNELVEFVRTHDEYYVAEFMFADNKRIAELEQDLDFTTKTANDLIEIKHKLEQELDTWKRACELACEKIVDIFGSCPIDTDNWERDDVWCEEHCKEHEKLLCWDRYFYQQAKKENNND